MAARRFAGVRASWAAHRHPAAEVVRRLLLRVAAAAAVVAVAVAVASVTTVTFVR